MTGAGPLHVVAAEAAETNGSGDFWQI